MIGKEKQNIKNIQIQIKIYRKNNNREKTPYGYHARGT